MILVSANVGPFRSMNTQQTVSMVFFPDKGDATGEQRKGTTCP